MLPGSIAYQRRNPDKILRRHQIMAVLLDFADSHLGATPTQRSLLTLFNQAERKRRLDAGETAAAIQDMSWAAFYRHMKTLEESDKLIRRCDGVIVICNACWRPPRNLFPLLC